MKQIINSKYLSTLIFILSIILVVKLLWISLALVFLPTTGQEYQQSNKAKKLYYRVRLNNASNVIPTIPSSIKKKNPVSSMRGYKLLGLYNSKSTLVVTVEKGRKTKILSKGESFDGFELSSAGATFAMFKKNGKDFKLALLNIKNITNNRQSSRVSSQSRPAQKSIKNDIVEEDGVKRIPKTLLTSYTKDMDKIWKDIGLSQYKKNGKADGFKINFIKRGSDMEKLGLKRGDILKAINAEQLNLSSAMGFFNNINNLENLTLTVERNGQDEELEYEIQ